MARVRFNANKASGKLKRDISGILRDVSLESEIGDFLIDRIKFEARKGSPLNNDRRFPSLSSLTISNRERLAKFNKTNRAFVDSKSNLTLTGQLQDAITFERISVGVFQLFVKDSKRIPYKTGPNSKAKTLSNSQVYDFLRSLGFYLFTSQGLRSDKKIPKRIKQILIRYLRRQLSRS